MDNLTHRERIKLLLQGKEIDRTPISFWRHFYHLENNAEDLAQAMLSFQSKFEWDFIKINPRASYHIEPFGAKVKFSQEEFKKPKVIELPLKSLSNWEKLKTFNSSPLKEQLKAIRLIKRKIKEKTFLVETIFSPLSIVSDLVPGKKLVQEMKESKESVHSALLLITEIFSNFAVDCLNAGADGIFFATTEWASKNLLTEKQYLEFGKTYDLKFLDKIKEAEFNILHICKANNMLNLFANYPVKAVSWEAVSSTNLSLKEKAKFLNKVVIGGIDYTKKSLGFSKEKIEKELEKIISENKGIRYILAPGCVIPPETPDQFLLIIKETIKKSGGL